MIATPDISCPTLTDTTTGNGGLPNTDDGTAHFSENTCNGATYTITEDLSTAPTPPPNMHWVCESPVGCSFTTPVCQNLDNTDVGTFMNRLEPNPTTVPEFPTLTVSLVTLVGLGLVVYTVKQRK
jgi:hypothetical protein